MYIIISHFHSADVIDLYLGPVVRSPFSLNGEYVHNIKQVYVIIIQWRDKIKFSNL
jgi:hypothetical protein